MSVKSPRELFVLMLSNLRQGTERTTKVFEEISQAAQDADVKEALEARVFVSHNILSTLDQCFNKGNPLYCGFITRRTAIQGAYSAGSLEYINQSPVNSGGQRAKGIDLTTSYAEKVGPGTLSARLSYTHLLDAWNKPTDDADKDTSLSEVGNARNRWSLNLGYSSGPWAINTTTTFIGKSYLDDQFMSSMCNEFDEDDNCVVPARKEQGKVASKTYFDLQGSYKWGKAQFYLGVNNLFNTKAPPIISGLPGDVTGAETDAGTYDAIGRRYYVGVRYSF